MGLRFYWAKVPRLGACLLLAIGASAVLSACGSSSNSSSSTGTSTVGKVVSTSSRPSAQVQREITKTRQALEKRHVAVSECLRKGGVSTLAKVGIQVSSQPPRGMTHTQYEALVNKCGGHIENPLLRQAFAKFATCMRANGVNFPTPNTSGKGPIFSAKGINTTSPAYRAAVAKCRSVLSTAFRASAGTRGSGRTAGSTSQAKPAPVVRPKVKVPPAITHDLERFTACMREHGVTSFPEPEGASFNTTHLHLDPNSAQYKAAAKTCEPILQAAFAPPK
jgi:hypothetical protein